MTDEQLPGEETGADEATSESAIDWEQRYKDTHSNWNQLNERMSRFEKDPSALIEFIQEKHPDLLAEDDEEPDTEDLYEPDEDDAPMTRAEFKQWQAEQKQQTAQLKGQELFEADLKGFAGDRELSKWADQSIRFRASQGEFNGAQGPEKLKAAVDEWFAEQEALAPKPRPRAPHVPSAGQAATDVPNWDDMTPGEINRYLVERVRAEEAQT